MNTKQEIVENWLPRYTDTPLDEFGKYILLVNFEDYLKIMNCLNLVNLLIDRAREAALGTRFSKRTPPPSRCRTVMGHFAPPSRPEANIHRLFGDPRGLRKSIDFRTPQNRPRWVTKSPIGRPMAANGSIWDAFGCHFGTHFR